MFIFPGKSHTMPLGKRQMQLLQVFVYYVQEKLPFEISVPSEILNFI